MADSRSRRSLAAALLPLALDRAAPLPLQRQLYDQVREAILAGRLAAAARLPSTRALARELGCSRNTVIGAYDQLFSEGYLEGETGSGTYVSNVLPDQMLGLSSRKPPGGGAARPGQDGAKAAARLSRRGARLAGLHREHRPGSGAFTPAFPETDGFPFDVWARLLTRAWRRPAPANLRHGDPAGYLPLRSAIADYLRTNRALNCTAAQVIITSGAQQCVSIVLSCLLDPGDRVWIEDPGYPGLTGPLIAAAAEAVPVPVDAEGLSLETALAESPGAGMAIVTPSHHYPLGVVMSLARRLALLDWAREAGSWILEDDYDSEYRFAGRPLSAMQGLDTAGRVIYIGSFSKVLFPSLRIGYLVAPEALAGPLIQARAALDDHPSILPQPALAAFLEEGHFAAHLRRMRRLYAARQEALIAAAERHLSGFLRLSPDEAGLHLVARLTPELAARMSDVEAAARAGKAGLVVRPLSGFYRGPGVEQGLLLGYAGVPVAEIEAGARTLGEVLRAP